MMRFFVSGWLAGLLVVVGGVMGSSRAGAQGFATVYSFTAVQSSTNVDGAFPEAGLVAAGNVLFGTAMGGGALDDGTVFSFDTSATNPITLHPFNAVTDGSGPEAAMILSGNTLYGTTHDGGAAGNGTVFSMRTDGTGFTNLHSFTAVSGAHSANGDGANPVGGLALAGGRLYGTAEFGGSAGCGTVFALDVSGSNFTTLHSFTDGGDGGFPQAGVVVSGGTLYGTAMDGGSAGNGTVFSLTTNGVVLLVLHSFGAVVFSQALQSFTNSDGAYPQGELLLTNGTLYGTAEEGGRGGSGTIFAVGTGGSGFVNLHSFAALASPVNHGANADGAYPLAGLTLLGNVLYGTANGGGSAGYGAVFAVNVSGGGFVNLHSFTAVSGGYGVNGDGAEPVGGLVVAGSLLYGTASLGGAEGAGTIFSVGLAPELGIAVAGGNVILTWPTNLAGFTLQSAATPGSTNWSAVSPGPVAVNGLNTVTNAATGAGRFYRLSKAGM